MRALLRPLTSAFAFVAVLALLAAAALFSPAEAARATSLTAHSDEVASGVYADVPDTPANPSGALAFTFLAGLAAVGLALTQTTATGKNGAVSVVFGGSDDAPAPKGAAKAAPKGAAKAAPKGAAYPEGFPAAELLQAAGVTSAADAQSLSRDELLALDGISDATADKVLAFKL